MFDMMLQVTCAPWDHSLPDALRCKNDNTRILREVPEPAGYKAYVSLRPRILKHLRAGKAMTRRQIHDALQADDGRAFSESALSNNLTVLLGLGKIRRVKKGLYEAVEVL